MTQQQQTVELNDIQQAHERIKSYIHRTPLLTNTSLSKWHDNHASDRKLYVKCENFNKIGAFKIRGATNAVLQQKQRQPDLNGICTHSSGNHAQAVACCAKMFNIKAHVIMPRTAPSVKRSAVEDTYGATVYLCEPTQKAREETCARVVQETGSHFIHPYDNFDVIAGQGTVFLEMLEQLREIENDSNAKFDAIICPIGGGGLMSGVSIACRGLLGSDCKIYGVEPEAANDAQRSLQSGTRTENASPPKTICDGLLTNLSDKTWSFVSKNVDQIYTVTDQEVTEAMKLVFERMKIVIEPSSATVIAAALFNKEFLSKNYKRVGLVISGGNIDLNHLPWLL
jgi:threonine dehydratase